MGQYILNPIGPLLISLAHIGHIDMETYRSPMHFTSNSHWASGQDKATGPAFNVLASGIGQVVNLANCNDITWKFAV